MNALAPGRMIRNASVFLGVTVWFFLAAGLGAQPTGTFVDTVDVQVVEIDVVVTDRKGRPVDGLEREDFELSVDGIPVEITNFHESAVFGKGSATGAGKRGAGTADERTEWSESPGGDALTVAFYLDDANIHPAHRSRLLGRLEAAIEPWRAMDARFMLARFENRLEVVVPPTSDLDAILEGAAQHPKGTTRALQSAAAHRLAIKSMIDSHEACDKALERLRERLSGNALERRRERDPGHEDGQQSPPVPASSREQEEELPRCRPCIDNWGELLSAARGYAENQATNAVIAVDGLADLSTTLAGVPGKKAVVYITDGLPQQPGSSALDYLGNRLCQHLRPTAPSETMNEIVQYDVTSRFNRLAAHANANRVTLYGLDAGGVRDATLDISLDNPALMPKSRNANLRNSNAQSGLHLIASETGGKALVNANDLSLLLGDVTKQLNASYSLGFLANERKPGMIRQVSVRLAQRAAKGRRVEYRRSYRDKSLEERLAERLFSVAYLGAAENPLGAAVDFGASKPLEKDVHELPVSVTVPAESVAALPGQGGESGRLRLWMLAVEGERGARTTVRQKTLAVGGAAGVAPVNGRYRFEVTMNLPAGDYQVAVGVRDEATGVMSLLRAPVSVPTAATPGRSGTPRRARR